MAMKPIVKWSGGKKDEIKMFQDHIPNYDTYIEPFVGGGGLYFHLAPQKAVIADVHDDLIAFYKSIKNYENFSTVPYNTVPYKPILSVYVLT